MSGPNFRAFYRITFLDPQGVQQTNEIRTTAPAPQNGTRQALEGYYSAMGCELLSLQQLHEAAEDLAFLGETGDQKIRLAWSKAIVAISGLAVAGLSMPGLD